MIWTVEEIRKLPEFGADQGWFYGLVRYEGKLYLSEIFPGLGFAQPRRGRVVVYPWWSPKAYWQVCRDLLRYRPPRPAA